MNIFYNVLRLKYEGCEKKGFIIDRPQGTNDFLFLHFKTPVNILMDDDIIHATPGTCLITTPNYRHWFESPNCDLIHDWVHFMPDNSNEFLKIGLPVNQLFNLSKVHFITPTIMNCESEYIHKELYWEENISSMLGTLFVNIVREIMHGENPPASKYILEVKDKFKKFRLMMYGQVEKDWTVDEMANELSLSRSRFTALYHDFFGVSPKDDLILARVEYAKYLLSGSNMKINVVAQKSGYANIYHFIRQFKKITNVTPSGYRNSL